MEMEKHGQSSTMPLYSELEAKALEGKLLKKETFREALQVLVAWLEDGQCNESNSAQFYSLILLCFNYLGKLQNKQEEFFAESQKTEEILRNKSCCMQLQLNKIEKVFMAIKMNNFSDSQKRKIQEMRKDIEDLKQNCATGLKSEEEEASSMADVNNEDVQSENVAHKVQTKAGSLTYGLNVVEQMSENSNNRCKDCQNEILKLQSELENRKKTLENEMTIIAVVSPYLYENKGGVSIDDIYSDLETHLPVTSAGEMEEVMRKYPSIFKESSPIEATEEKKWTCISINQETMALLDEK